MKELNDFATCIKCILESKTTLDIDSARESQLVSWVQPDEKVLTRKLIMEVED